MKVAYYVYPTAFQSPGGGEVLLLKTKEYVEKQGVSVKLLDPWSDKIKSFDLLHTFGSVKDSLSMIRVAKDAGIKTVLSTVCWYSLLSAWGIGDSWGPRLGALVRHAGKTLCPWIPSERKTMMELSDLLIPNSESEAQQLSRYFLIPREKITTIPNAVDPRFLEAKPEPFRERLGLHDFILCVGRIEPRKNQLGMIRALKNCKVPVIFIGDYVPAYKAYYERCRQEADPTMHFLGFMDHDSDLLASAYAACNTFLLASWLETPGLAALEAGLAGAKVVLTNQGATREYFRDYASYCSPHRLSDIRQKTLASLRQARNGQLKSHIQKNYLWPEAARKTIQVYKNILNEPARSKKGKNG